jgi:hypothetical protein
MDLKKMLEEWHETKSVSLASDICQELWDEMEDFEDEPELD